MIERSGSSTPGSGLAPDPWPDRREEARSSVTKTTTTSLATNTHHEHINLYGRDDIDPAPGTAQDHPNPCDSGAVAAVMSGIRRQVGTDQLRRAAPLELEPLELVLAPIDTATLAGQRDRALLLIGFAAALRRSELVALNVEDLEFDTARGLKLTIRKSKTDHQQAGAQVAVPYARETNRCAVRALSQVAASREDPPRAGVSPDAPRRHRRRRAPHRPVRRADHQKPRAAHLPAELLPKLSAHSLRAGYATAAAAAEIEERKIANVTRHKKHHRPAPLHPGRHRVRRRRRSAVASTLSRDRTGGRGGPGTRRGGLDGTFIAVSDLVSLLEPAITAEYRLALLHAAAPGHKRAVRHRATEELMGWHARAAMQPS